MRTSSSAIVLFPNSDIIMRVLVLAGGDSEEKDISTASGHAVARSIDHLHGYESVLVNPSERPWQQVACDIVFPVLHGFGGEDGRLQRILEAEGRRFVGSSSAASQLTFDKIACSKFLRQHAIACPVDCVLRREDSGTDRTAALKLFLQEQFATKQWIVKPNRQGSSVGISVVESVRTGLIEQMLKAVDRALTFDGSCIVQPYIFGRELTVSLIDGYALPVVEVFACSGVYDYDAKYQSATTSYAIIADESAKRATQIARQVNELCQTRGIVRIDFRIDEEGRPWFLELNSIPGMTDRSLVPMSARELGWSMSELCRRAIVGSITS